MKVFVLFLSLFFVLNVVISQTYGIVSLENENETSPKTGNENNTTVLCLVIYENKCFIAVIGRQVNYDGGVAVCTSRGGYLANIYSQTHMDDVMKYIRENRMDGTSWREFRLGMKYDPKAKKRTLRDGTDAPVGLKWYNGFPLTVEASSSYDDYTGVMLVVNSDQSSSYQYLLNWPPWSQSYVLCEIRLNNNNELLTGQPTIEGTSEIAE